MFEVLLFNYFLYAMIRFVEVREFCSKDAWNVADTEMSQKKMSPKLKGHKQDCIGPK